MSYYYSYSFIIAFLASSIIVAVDTYSRFYLPFEIRSTTTKLSYWLAAFSYIFIYITILILLSNSLVILYLSKNDKSIANFLGSIESTYLFSAMIIVLTIRFTVIRRMDKSLQRYIRELSGIPTKATILARTLRSTDYIISQNLRKDIEKKLTERGIKLEHINYQNDNSVQYVWTKLTSLMVQLELMQADRKFHNFFIKAKNKFDIIRSAYEKTLFRAAKLFDLNKEYQQLIGKNSDINYDLLKMEEICSGTSAETDLYQRSISEIKSYFYEQTNQLENSILSFISRAVLYCRLRRSERQSILVNFGFAGINLRTSWLAYSIPLLLIFPFFFIIFFSFYSFSGIRSILIMVSMITTSYLVSVGVAVFIKTRYWFANIFYINYRSFKSILTIAYTSVIIGLFAVVVTFPIIFFFKFLFFGGGLYNTVTGMIVKWPWFILPGTAAMVTAILIDENFLMYFRNEISGRRWKEGLLGFLSLGFAMLIADFFLTKNYGIILLIAQGTVGFIIGFFVPFWYRNRYKINDYSLDKIQRQKFTTSYI